VNRGHHRLSGSAIFLPFSANHELLQSPVWIGGYLIADRHLGLMSSTRPASSPTPQRIIVFRSAPSRLGTTSQALDALGPKAEGVQPIFITIDPERDTEVLADYLKAFYPASSG
jgi:hypothetical protein